MGNRRCRLSELGCLSRVCCRRSKCAVRVSRFRGVWCFSRRNWISRCFCAAPPATPASDARQRRPPVTPASDARQRRPLATPPTRRLDPNPMGDARGSSPTPLTTPTANRRHSYYGKTRSCGVLERSDRTFFISLPSTTATAHARSMMVGQFFPGADGRLPIRPRCGRVVYE